MENVEEMGEGGRERKEKGWEKKKGQEKKKVKKKRGGGMRQAPNSVSLPSHPRTGASVSMRRIVGNVEQCANALPRGLSKA